MTGEKNEMNTVKAISRPWGRKKRLSLLPPRGFTLIEILVVLGVLGILIAILLPILNSGLMRARIAGNLSNLRELTKASLLYANENNGFLPEASFAGNSIFARTRLPILPLLREGYVSLETVSSPLSVDLSKAAGGEDQVPVPVAGYSGGQLVIDWAGSVSSQPNVVAFESWANPGPGWNTRGAVQRLAANPKNSSGQIQDTGLSKMKMIWNYEFDIPVNLGILAIGFGDGHVESRTIDEGESFVDVMARE